MLYEVITVRKLFFAPYRARRLRAEVPQSLQRLAEVLGPRVEPVVPLTMVGIWAHPDDESYLSRNNFV